MAKTAINGGIVHCHILPRLMKHLESSEPDKLCLWARHPPPRKSKASVAPGFIWKGSGKFGKVAWNSMENLWNMEHGIDWNSMEESGFLPAKQEHGAARQR